jgi:anion-transporting  ArsA/GET3 family ATPase
MWSDFHDAVKPRKRPWSEAPTNTIWVFSGGCSSVLHREVLVQNVKKKFWNLWRKYKKRRRKNKFLLKKKHLDRTLKRKEQLFYSFLEETEYCGFNRFSSILEEAKRFDPIREMLTEELETKEEFLFNHEYQRKFSMLVSYCFDVDIAINNQLNLEELMQQIEEFGVGEIWIPLNRALKKSITKSIFLQKVIVYKTIPTQIT